MDLECTTRCYGLASKDDGAMYGGRLGIASSVAFHLRDLGVEVLRGQCRKFRIRIMMRLHQQRIKTRIKMASRRGVLLMMRSRWENG